jgi:hypothetical protein
VVGISGVPHAKEKTESDDGNEIDHFALYRRILERL